MPAIVVLAWVCRPPGFQSEPGGPAAPAGMPQPASAQKIIGLKGARSHDMAVPSLASEPGVSSAMWPAAAS
jgi:hypothetical protein